jgi:hypothetical protein
MGIPYSLLYVYLITAGSQVGCKKRDPARIARGSAMGRARVPVFEQWMEFQMRLLAFDPSVSDFFGAQQPPQIDERSTTIWGLGWGWDLGWAGL